MTALGLSEYAKVSMRRQIAKNSIGGEGTGKGGGKIDVSSFLSEFESAMRRWGASVKCRTVDI